MSQIQAIAGTGLPLRGDDIDTDRIIPARFLRCVTFDGLGDHVFEDDRKPLAGQHPFDRPEFSGAKVLVVNRNFGCGSSREHAPQAIARWGIEVIVGESFAEIFFANCTAIGVPCLTGDRETVQGLQDAIAANPAAEVAIDLDGLTVTCADMSGTLEMKAGARQAFLTGQWDSCGQLVAGLGAVQTTAARLPYIAWSE